KPGGVPARGEHPLRLDQQAEVGGPELQRQGESLRGGLPPVEPLGEHLRLVEEQRSAGARGLGGGQLRVEELEGHSPVADVGEDSPRRAEVLHEARSDAVGGLEGGGGGAEVAQRPFPEQAELVVQARASRVGLQRPGLPLQRGDARPDLRGDHVGHPRGGWGGRSGGRLSLRRFGHAARAASRSAPESMSRPTASMSRWISRSTSRVGTDSRSKRWAAATPRPARSGRRKSRACAATSSSTARQLRVKSATWRALSAAVIPMLTWSSRPAEEGMESTEAGWLSPRDSATRAAEVTWAIMKPELSPEFRARKGGSPLRAGFTSCSTRRSLIADSWVQAMASTSRASETGCPWKLPPETISSSAGNPSGLWVAASPSTASTSRT